MDRARLGSMPRQPCKGWRAGSAAAALARGLTHGVRVDGAVGVVGDRAAVQAREEAQRGQAVRQHAHRQVVHVPQLGAHPAGLDALPGQPQTQTHLPSPAQHQLAAMRHTARIGRWLYSSLAEALAHKRAHHLAGPVNSRLPGMGCMGRGRATGGGGRCRGWQSTGRRRLCGVWGTFGLPARSHRWRAGACCRSR